MKLKNPPITQHSRICSEHFTEDCYERDLKSELLGTKIKYNLKEDAVPTIFNFSSYKRATVHYGGKTYSTVWQVFQCREFTGKKASHGEKRRGEKDETSEFSFYFEGTGSLLSNEIQCRHRLPVSYLVLWW